MQVFQQKSALLTFIKNSKSANLSIGFVPTMGALHKGHLSLMQQSLAQNDLTIVSIFVNPTQFNNSDDLEKYPRTLQDDIEKIKLLNDKIIVFAPSVNDMYGTNTVSENFEFDGLEFEMEGKHRPGHFDGVGTIVKKLFDYVEPNKAYFGEKDFQQLQIIRKMVEKLQLPVEIIPCEIFREVNGLAMSSRNERLTSEERNQAAIIYQVLKTVREKCKTNPLSEIHKWVAVQFENIPNFRLEYFEIAHEKTLKSIENLDNTSDLRAFIAVFVNNIRLIDNISLK
jgi:pantoate--beta-alanine ligase